MANKWVTHDHSNYPPGGPESADYLADADEFNQNYEDICDAIGARYVRGIACADKNSTETTCEIWLQADGGERDVCDAGWYALIYYGTANVWETTVSVSGSDCYVVFGDGELENPETSGISDYAAAAFIDALHVILFPKKMMLPADWLITTEGAGGVLGTEEIYHEGQTLAAFINDVEARLGTVAKTTGEGGGLVDNVVTSDAIAGTEAVMADNSVNLLAGGSLEHYGDEHDVLFKVEKIGDGAFEITEEVEETDGSARAQKVTAGGSNVGIALSLNPNFADKILAGKDVAATFRVKTDTNNSLEVGFWDGGSNYYTDTPDINAGTWTSLTVTKEIPGTVTDLKAIVRSTTGPVEFIVARVQMNLGDKAFGFSIAPYEDAARILMDTTQDNLLYNGGFERWTLTGQYDPPDGWFVVGTPEFGTMPTGGMPEGTGNKLCKITLKANDGMGQYLGLVTDGGDGTCVNENILVGLIRGSKVCASVDLMLDQTTSAPITLVLGDRYDSTSDEEEFVVTPPSDEMRRFTIYKEITPDAKQVYFKILNKEAATVIVNVDNAMLHVGEFPLMFKPSAGWREMRWDFSDSTASVGSDMDAEGIAGGKYPMPENAAGYLMLKAAARCLEVADGDTTYKLFVDDDTTAEGVSITILNGQDNAENHIITYSGTGATKHECTQYIKTPECSETGAGTPAEGVIFSVWGYYYAS